MKIIYLIGSIILTALILTLAFENISAQCTDMYFFFYSVKSNPTVVTLSIALLGIITGALYHAFLVRAMATPEEDESESF